MLQDKTAAPDSHPNADAAHPSTPSLHAAGIVASMDRANTAWHAYPGDPSRDDRVTALHRANFELWHLEDAARSASATAAEIADVKRAIDQVNQRRNDAAEAVDADLLAQLAPAGLPNAEAPLHSETPGQMLDRLSILSLKRFHTEEETRRDSALPAHHQNNRVRLAILHEQSVDLAACLQDLWSAVLSGDRRFKRYLQLKMYNDPDLNPVLYRVASKR